MDSEKIIDTITASLARFSGDITKAQQSQLSSEQIIASAEYELEQVKKLLAAHKLAA